MQEAGLLPSPAPPATLGRRFPQFNQASKLSLALPRTPPRRQGSLRGQDNTPSLDSIQKGSEKQRGLKQAPVLPKAGVDQFFSTLGNRDPTVHSMLARPTSLRPTAREFLIRHNMPQAQD